MNEAHPVHPALGGAIEARGFTTLTDVQVAVSSPDFAGKDLLVSARTGSGKTVAFGLAIAEGLLDEKPMRRLLAHMLLLLRQPVSLHCRFIKN
jgi:ATP-dependent RNA helicase DeaD